MKQGESCMKDTGNFLEKFKAVEKTPKWETRLGPSIAHDTEAWKTFENCITNPSTKWFLLKIS